MEIVFSSRFTDSGKYEDDCLGCFKLESARIGEICNACVLIVKRWKKLPTNTTKHWAHVVDARTGPGIKNVFKNKKKEELMKQLEELKTELQQLRVAKVTGGAASKLAKIKVVRKSIARVNTVCNQKVKLALRTQFKDAKYLPLDLRVKKTRAIRRALTKKEKSIKTLKQTKKEKHFPQRKFAVKA